jgi:hypothetical protein
MDDVGGWCPSCGGEYRPGFTTCFDCGVALVHEEPVFLEEDEREPLVYDLGGMTPGQRHVLGLLLDGRDVVHEWRGEQLVFAAGSEPVVDELVGEFDTTHALEPPDEGAAIEEPAGPVVAGAPRRALGYLVDLVVSQFSAGALYFLLVDRPVTRLIGLVGGAALASYSVVPIALWGRTIGMALVRVRAADGAGRAPGWRRSLIRWCVPHVVALLILPVPRSSLPRAAGWVSWSLMLVTYLTVVTRADRRGLHDLAAGVTIIRG